MRREFTIQLNQVFQGPMDLLLHLVKEQEVEIYEVEIHTVIEGYFGYLGELEALDIEVAGDFLVMAATLMAIKSRSLLPREEVELEDELDPQDELIQRLIEYRRFKGASEDLEERLHRRSLEHARGFQSEVREWEPEKTLELGDLTVWDLLATFSRLMRETLSDRPHRVLKDARPLRWFVRNLGETILRERRSSLRSLLLQVEGTPTREGMIGAFCALLELVKIGVVSAEQTDQHGDIEVVLRDEVEGDLEDLIDASRFMDEGLPDDDMGEPEAETEAGLEQEPEAAADVSEGVTEEAASNTGDPA